MTRLLAVEFLPHSSPPDQFYSDIVRAYSLCDTLSRTDCPIRRASENKGTVTRSSRRRSCRHLRHLLSRRLRLPLRLLPRLALVEGGHRQLPTDQEGLSRGILGVFCSCPMVRPKGVLAFSYLAFPHLLASEKAPKQPSFDGELMADSRRSYALIQRANANIRKTDGCRDSFRIALGHYPHQCGVKSAADAREQAVLRRQSRRAASLPTSICRSKVTICSGLYLYDGHNQLSFRWILSFHLVQISPVRSGSMRVIVFRNNRTS